MKSAAKGQIENYQIMKASPVQLGLLIATALAVGGCGRSDSRSGTVAEGVIFSVEYQMEGGRTEGFTRVNDSRAVPGGNGSFMWMLAAV